MHTFRVYISQFTKMPIRQTYHAYNAFTLSKILQFFTVLLLIMTLTRYFNNYKLIINWKNYFKAENRIRYMKEVE